MADGTTTTNGRTEEAAPTVKAEAAANGRRSLRVGLVPVNNSDQPVVANYTSVNAGPGMGFIDFGFLEPGMLTALPGVARRGGKVPETIAGKLSVRLAMGYDTLANLHQQLGAMIAGLQAVARQQQSAQTRE